MLFKRWADGVPFNERQGRFYLWGPLHSRMPQWAQQKIKRLSSAKKKDGSSILDTIEMKH